MRPFSIIIHFNVFKDFSFCLFPSPEFHSVDKLYFKRMGKTLGYRIVPAVTFFAHAAANLMLSQQCLKIVAGILAWIPKERATSEAFWPSSVTIFTA